VIAQENHDLYNGEEFDIPSPQPLALYHHPGFLNMFVHRYVNFSVATLSLSLSVLTFKTHCLVDNKLPAQGIEAEYDGYTNNDTQWNQFRGNLAQSSKALRDCVGAMFLFRNGPHHSPRWLEHSECLSGLHCDGGDRNCD